MIWTVSWRADPRVARLADRHYSRQSHGSRQFSPPGRVYVLVTDDGLAAWVTHWPRPDLAMHGRGDAWVCSLFRNEGPFLSSDLIRQAVAATRARWPTPPAGMLTFVDTDRIRPKRDPGRCFRRAGFKEVGRTKDRDLVVLQLAVDAMPEPAPALGVQEELALA